MVSLFYLELWEFCVIMYGSRKVFMMSTFSGIGILFTILIYALALYIAYLVITVAAVRHGIDNSEVGKMLKKKQGYQKEKYHSNDDLDKDH